MGAIKTWMRRVKKDSWVNWETKEKVFIQKCPEHKFGWLVYSQKKGEQPATFDNCQFGKQTARKVAYDYMRRNIAKPKGAIGEMAEGIVNLLGMGEAGSAVALVGSKNWNYAWMYERLAEEVQKRTKENFNIKAVLKKYDHLLSKKAKAELKGIMVSEKL